MTLIRVDNWQQFLLQLLVSLLRLFHYLHLYLCNNGRHLTVVTLPLNYTGHVCFMFDYGGSCLSMWCMFLFWSATFTSW